MFWQKKTGAPVNHGSSSDTMNRYNAGVGFLQVGNINKAIEVFAELARQDHPSATFNLALLYAQGHGPRLMLREAPELFMKAAELGNAKAATFYSLFEQFIRGFQPGAGVSALLNTGGMMTTPVLIIHAMAADIILRLGSRKAAIVYASIEAMDLTADEGKGEEFTELLNFDKMAQIENWVDVDRIRVVEGTPEAVAKNIRRILASCVNERGMTEETALFIRCSVLGTVCKANGLTTLKDLPSIEFYA